MKVNFKILLVHVLGWIVLIYLPLTYVPRPSEVIMAFMADNLYLPIILNYAGYITLLYLNYYVFIPNFWFSGRRLKYWILVAVNMLTLMSLPLAFLATNHNFNPDLIRAEQTISTPLILANNVFLFLLILLVSMLLRQVDHMQTVEREKVAVELAYLKSQIQPHFFFNVLNNIYALSLAKSKQASAAILKLSSIMRYSITSHNPDSVSLQQEVKFITDYMSLQRLRLTAKTEVSCEISGVIDSQQIAPFMLITFIENAFKFGVNSERNSHIRIRIQVWQEKLVMVVSNLIVYRPEEDDQYVYAPGQGLQNTRKRLQLLYPNRHTLIIKSIANEFNVELNLIL